MKIILANEVLAPSVNFLGTIKLKGKDSRARTKLVNLLTQQVRELQESEQELIDEYAKTDENGKPEKAENGNTKIDPDRAKEYLAEHSKLMLEQVEIEGGTYVNHIDDCEKILNDYDGELEGANAQAYDALLDAFEAAKNEKEGE
jgi:hypothetical protein